MKKQISILLFCILFIAPAFAQNTKFSLASDFSVLRSFKKGQRFWAFGQTVAGHFHFTPKDGLYAWLAYYSNGKFSNPLTATAKDTTTFPQQTGYTNRALLRFRHISIGWKHYLKGASNIESKWSLYGYAGFGLMLGSVTNTHSVAIDSSFYFIPVIKGHANFKRLTFDLGLGYEKPVGGDIYVYMEGRVLIPTTDYPSNYLFINKDAPLNGSFNAGVRIFFD